MDTTSAPIIGGSLDYGDPAVVAFAAQTSQTGVLCTGEIISPHVVLTAGHCVSPDIQTGFYPSTFQVFTGTSVAAPTATLAVSAVHPHPFYNPVTGGENDVAVAILAEATAIPPLAYNQSPTLADGTPVRVVGYGQTQDGVADSDGTKNSVAGQLSQISATHFIPTVLPATQCHGDSGGPTFIDSNGQSLIVGIGWQTVDTNGLCDQGVQDTRIDPFAGWIGAQVAAAEGAGGIFAGLPFPNASFP